VTLRGKHRLRVFGDKALRKIFEPRRDEVTGACRKLHNKELLHNFYSLPSIFGMVKSRRKKWPVYIARMREWVVGGAKAKWKETIRKTKT
jgi:hypothetical protein